MPSRVAFAITHRLLEGSLSVELLCAKNRVRDSAILLLSLLELRLDLQYIDADTSRADRWLDHQKAERKPWPVALQLKEIYTEPSESEAERWLYRQFSMAKHGNPVGGLFAFPIAARWDGVDIDICDSNSQLIGVYAFALGSYIHLAGTAAARIWGKDGLDIADYTERLDKHFETISESNKQHVLSMVQRYLNLRKRGHTGQ